MVRRHWRIGSVEGFAPVINALLVAGCVYGFSLSTASGFGAASFRGRAHNHNGRASHRCGRGAPPKNRPAALSAWKGGSPLPSLLDDPSLAFVGPLRDGLLKAMGLEELVPSAVEDESWGRQIINATNIRGQNITADAVAETWRRVQSGEDDGDATDHIWRDLIGDWSKVRGNKLLMAGVRAGCIAVLTWGFCESVVTSLSISGIRMWTAMRQRSFAMRWDSFLHVETDHRTVIFNTYDILKVRFGTLFFALKVRMRWLFCFDLASLYNFFSSCSLRCFQWTKALGTLMTVSYYESCVCTIESICFSKEYRKKYPLVSRLQGLVMSVLVGWLFARAITLVGVFLCTAVGLGKLWVVNKLNGL